MDLTDDFEIARGVTEAVAGDVKDDDQAFVRRTMFNAELAELAESSDLLKFCELCGLCVDRRDFRRALVYSQRRAQTSEAPICQSLTALK